MAKELGFQPKSLIKNIPSPSQKWKTPVKEWITGLYEKKIASRKPADGVPSPSAMRNPVIEFRDPQYPWPDRPIIPELVVYEPNLAVNEDGEPDWRHYIFENRYEPPSEEDTEEHNNRMLRRQCLFRWAAQLVAIAMNTLPEVQKVAAFGAVARPLEMEVPRFSQFRRHRIEVLHQCADLDLAVWTDDLSHLKELKRAMSRGLSLVQDTHYGGVAHHQVDVHILDAGSGAYRGRLCSFGQCPKPGKRECRVPGCGAQPFLRQFEGYSFNPARFEGEPRVTLLDKAGGYLVRAPWMDAKPARIVYRTPARVTGHDLSP
jgi:hypothetical protein